MFTPIMAAFYLLIAILGPVTVDAAANGDPAVSGDQAALSLAPELGKIVARCAKPKPGTPEIYLFKQWHADPSIDTHARDRAASLPQAENQTAIFRQLDRWIAHGTLRTIVAEGCTGELNRTSQSKYNGWSMRELERESRRPGYDAIVASVPQKLEARYGARLHVACGDDPALIREHLRAFSDLRGAFESLARLGPKQDDPAKARLRRELHEAWARMRKALDRRNDAVISAVRGAGLGPIAVVYGGAHAVGLREKLEVQGFRCSVIEPAGYRNDEAKLMEELEAAVAKS